MFYVTSLDGSKVEPLINIGMDFRMEQSVDGTFNVSFSCFPANNNPGYQLLSTKSIINIEDYEFVVEQYSDNGISKSVTAISSFFANSKVRKNEIFTGLHVLREQLNFALSGTGWNYTVEGDIGNVTNYIEGFGNDNVIALIEKLVKYHQIEYIILPNRNILFSKKIGRNNDDQYRYKYNVSDVVLKEDTSNLYTVVRGYGADGMAVVYRSPNVSIFGELEAEPIRDESFSDPQLLIDYIKNQIQDVPELVIESNIPELTSKDTGETVWLIYEPLNIEMETRILKQNKTLINGRLITSSVVFGNSLIKSSVDLLVNQKQEIKEVNEEVEKTKGEYRSRFDTTDQRITLEVEQIGVSIAAIDIKADNINLSVNNRITNEVAAIDIRADQIRSSVSDLDARTSSSITQLSDNINLKIDKGGAITDINLSPGQATINADRINLNGAVVVNGSITGATNINVSNSAIIGTTLQVGQDSQASFPKAIRFAGQFGSAGIGYSNGDLTISAVNSIYLDADNISVRGELSGNINASSVNGVTISFTGKVATFRQSGSYIGTVTLD